MEVRKKRPRGFKKEAQVLNQKVHADSKYDLKTLHTISEGVKFFDRTFSVNDDTVPKFEEVTKKVPTPRTFELLAFDEKYALIFLLSFTVYSEAPFMP